MTLLANKILIIFQLKQMFKSLIDVKKIYIRTVSRQYIKSSSLSIIKYRLMSISLLSNKLTVNVNNALNLYINEILYFIYISKIVKKTIKIKKKNVDVISL